MPIQNNTTSDQSNSSSIQISPTESYNNSIEHHIFAYQTLWREYIRLTAMNLPSHTQELDSIIRLLQFHFNRVQTLTANINNPQAA